MCLIKFIIIIIIVIVIIIIVVIVIIIVIIVKFVNLSISSLGVFSKECDAFLDMLNDLRFDDRHRKYCIGKIMSIAIRSTYYIFCCRNKDWSTPELLAI